MLDWILKARLGVMFGLIAVAGCVSMRQHSSPYSVCLPRAGGGLVHFSEFRGRVLMVDFFTTWSHASTISVPGYTALYWKYKDRGLSAVGVALDELAEPVVPFLEGMQIPYPVALADERLRKGKSVFGNVEVTPLLLIFDQNGRLRKIFVGHVPLRKVEEVLDGLLP